MTALFLPPLKCRLKTTDLRIGQGCGQRVGSGGGSLVFLRPLLPTEEVLAVLLHAPQRLLCEQPSVHSAETHHHGPASWKSGLIEQQIDSSLEVLVPQHSPR